MVFARAAAEYHYTDEGTTEDGCEGHGARLIPFEILDADGTVIAGFDPLSPVVYLMERLTPLLGVEDQVLHLSDRAWALDCTTD